jgi:hypothetical protein
MFVYRCFQLDSGDPEIDARRFPWRQGCTVATSVRFIPSRCKRTFRPGHYHGIDLAMLDRIDHRHPKGVVVQADHLVYELMARRGYPMGDFEHPRRTSPSAIRPWSQTAAREIALRDERGGATPAKTCARASVE